MKASFPHIALTTLILILSPFSQAMTEREQYPTCANFSDDVKATSAKVTETAVQDHIRTVDFLILAESHSSTDFKNATPWIRKTIQEQDFDCLLLEMPANIAADNNNQYTGAIADHPFLQTTGKESEARKPWLEYLKVLITESDNKGLKIFHIDLPEDQLSTAPGESVKNIIRRNDYIARSVARLIDTQTCKKPLLQSGMAHITSTYYINMSFKEQTVPSVPTHPALKDRKFISVNISNSIFDYLVPESLNLCFGPDRGYFLRTENLSSNLPYSSQLGKVKDFTYILVPEPVEPL